jgi:hypothetical protein
VTCPAAGCSPDPAKTALTGTVLRQAVVAILQIEEYARAVIRLGNLPSEDEVERRARARISRQEILAQGQPAEVWAVLDKRALRRNIGGPEVMKAQLRHLIGTCDLPAVTLQILPSSSRSSTTPSLICAMSSTGADRR